MPHVTRRTPAVDARILELSKQGLSLRAIGRELEKEGTPLARPTITAVVAEARAQEEFGAQVDAALDLPVGTESANGEGDGLGEVLDGVPPDHSDDIEDDGGVDEDLVDPMTVKLPTLPEHASVSAQLCYLELLEVREVASKVRRRVLLGKYPMNQWVQAKKQIHTLLLSLGRMIPPPPVDPSKDPMSLACREMTHGQVLSAVRVAQAQLGHLCPACREGLVERG